MSPIYEGLALSGRRELIKKRRRRAISVIGIALAFFGVLVYSFANRSTTPSEDVAPVAIAIDEYPSEVLLPDENAEEVLPAAEDEQDSAEAIEIDHAPPEDDESEAAPADDAEPARENEDIELSPDELEPLGPPSPYQMIYSEITGPLGPCLTDVGVDPLLIGQIVTALEGVLDFGSCRKGDQFSVTIGPGGDLVQFTYDKNSLEQYLVERDADGRLVGVRRETNIERRLVGVTGVVRSVLYNSVYDIDESPALIMDFAMIFAWDIDFSLMTRVGDSYKMIVEKLYQYNKFVGYGRIMAASYKGYFGEKTGVWFEVDEKTADYFTPEGKSLRKSFLRAPLRFDRISSAFSHSRLHPVLKIRRPHHGVDYAARRGTPVWAVADGTISARGWDRGGGNYLKVRHNNGWVTTYMHLNGFARKTGRGSYVRQKQVIGYVGATGLATGPHLDYRIKIGKNYVNPLRIDYPAGDPVPDAEMDRFLIEVEKSMILLEQMEPAFYLEETNTAVGVGRKYMFPNIMQAEQVLTAAGE